MFVYLFYSAFAVLSVLVVACTVIVFVKMIKKHSVQNNENYDENLDTNSEENIIRYNKCEYCGTELNNDILICSSCGAKNKKNN